MKVLDALFAKQFINLCDNGYKKGWHERNGGNLSYRIKDEEIASIKENLNEDSNNTQDSDNDFGDFDAFGDSDDSFDGNQSFEDFLNNN